MLFSRSVLKHSNSLLGYPSVLCRYSLNQLRCLYRRPSIPLTEANLSLTAAQNRVYSTPPSTNQKPLTAAEKLKAAVKDYGSTVIIFHVTISLISLGCCYLAVYSGFDVTEWLKRLNLDFGDRVSTVAGASTFVIAYSIHKLFAPVRISITLATTPFIVRYLRNAGILKPPKLQK